MTDSSQQKMVVMGRIVAPYGVLGWVKIKPDTETLKSLFDYSSWWLGKGKTWREVAVEKVKVHQEILVAKLDGVDDRDLAIACKGQLVAVPRADLPDTEDNEYYWSDLVGLKVSNQAGENFGRVTQLFETGANDVLVVKTDGVDENGQKAEKIERLIPFIDQVVLAVDLDNQTMLVDWDADF